MEVCTGTSNPGTLIGLGYVTFGHLAQLRGVHLHVILSTIVPGRLLIFVGGTVNKIEKTDDRVTEPARARPKKGELNHAPQSPRAHADRW